MGSCHLGDNSDLVMVPLVASGLGGGEGRADRFFLGGSVPLMFLLVAFVPRFSLSPAMAAAATLAFSGAAAAGYLALSPGARWRWLGLLVVLSLVDAAGIAAVHFSEKVEQGPRAVVLFWLS